MSIRRFPGVPRGYLAILACASWLVPGRQRGEWSAEWKTELWYVWQKDNRRASREPGIQKDAAAFCLGAFADAFWFRRNAPTPDVPKRLPWNSAQRCIGSLSIMAGACLVLALLLPNVRQALLQPPYPAADGLVLIVRGGYRNAALPTITVDEYREWKRRRRNLLTDFALYQPMRSKTQIGAGRAAALSVAVASNNLFELLQVPLSSLAIEQARREHRPALVLSGAASRRYFTGDADPAGKVLDVAGRRAVVVGVVSGASWRLPGKMDAWLLEDGRGLASLQPDSPGFVLGHLTKAARAGETRERWNISMPTEGGYTLFDCVPLAEQMPQPFPTFLFTLMLACLALPATTPLPLGDYPATGGALSAATRCRRWVFFTVKIAFILPIVYCGSLNLAYLSPSLSPVSSEYIQLLASFSGFLFSFRWALRDQRRRCPVCLRRLTNPACVGQPSRNFLAWHGTEFICGRGHGLLHVPDLATSWFGTQRWLYLDASWNGLFHEAYLPSAGMF